MGFSTWVCRLVAGGLLGFGGVGCGQVTELKGGEGAFSDGSAEERTPAATERFAFAKSGQRSRAVGYLSEDVAQFRTLRDELLGFDCQLEPDSPGPDFHRVPKQTTALIFLD